MGYYPAIYDFEPGTPRGKSLLTSRNKGRTSRERAKNARRIARRLARDKNRKAPK